MIYRTSASSRISLLFVVYAVGFLYFKFAHCVDPITHYIRLDIYECLGPLLAGIMGVWLITQETQGDRIRRVGWYFVASACFLWMIGDILWAAIEVTTRAVPSFLSVADIAFFGAYVSLTVGVFQLFGTLPKSLRTRLWIDTATVACGIGVLTWYFLFRPLWLHAPFHGIGRLLVMASEFIDLTVLGGSLILAFASGLTLVQRNAFALVAIGVLMFASADTGDAIYEINNGYHAGLWTDTCRQFAWLAFASAFATIRGYGGVIEEPNRATQPLIEIEAVLYRFRSAIAPYVLAIIACFVTVCHDFLLHGSISLTTAVCGFAVLLLVITRQFLTFVENHRLAVALASQLRENEVLNSRLHEFNITLKGKVALRDHQLYSMQRLARDVRDCETVEAVAIAAVANARHALGADASALWLGQESTGDPESCYHDGFEGHAHILALISKSVRPDLLADKQARSVMIGGRNVLFAPLVSQGQIIGAIAVGNWGGAFEHEALAMVESIGVEIGAAMDYACKLAAAAELVERDAVTGVFNHCTLQRRFAEMVNEANESEEPLAVILLDINNFTLFNNTHGHATGDTVLGVVAGVLAEHTDPSMCVGRYGGDEFLIIVPQATTAQGVELAQSLRNRVATLCFESDNTPCKIPITLSIGVASLPEDANNRHELMAIVHRNLYSAKGVPDNIASSSGFRKRNRELREEATFTTLDAIVTAIDNKDSYTRSHSEDVTEYALMIAEKLCLDEPSKKLLRLGGLLHDVGKIGIPAEIISKPGPLTHAEYEVMKTHPHLGWLIVRSIPGMEHVLDAVRSHHERWDGKGYPDGLRRDQIPLVGRILAVADAFSAMTTDRPYRKGMTIAVAIQELRDSSGTQFDPTVADALIAALLDGHHVRIEHTSVPSSR